MHSLFLQTTYVSVVGEGVGHYAGNGDWEWKLVTEMETKNATTTGAVLLIIFTDS